MPPKRRQFGPASQNWYCLLYEKDTSYLSADAASFVISTVNPSFATPCWSVMAISLFSTIYIRYIENYLSRKISQSYSLPFIIHYRSLMHNYHAKYIDNCHYFAVLERTCWWLDLNHVLELVWYQLNLSRMVSPIPRLWVYVGEMNVSCGVLCVATHKYSKRSLAIPAETTGRFFPLFTKSNWAIIYQIYSVYQMDIANFCFFTSWVRRKLSNSVNIVTV